MPRSIIDSGLQEYLELTRSTHNIQGYSQFNICMKYKVPVSAMSRIFNVNRKTINKWQEIYKQENEDMCQLTLMGNK